ncbi:uncharacterized protein LOC114939993 [Nylanderia fulva]|uniref:uncharacterized protein LOC114939993 n=1 Tax=Nylanderia fulva TaxID=613905 RepID=UPI0010FAF011|nr:uncharacterized protein LOC114939993 [Nylanderia fulva]
MLICDSPAKSFALFIKGHTGHFSCTKCEEEGEMFNHVLCFTETERFYKRTDHTFRTTAQPEHHIGKSGMKRLLCHKRYGWIYGKPPHKLRARDVNKISENLLKLKQYVPYEFSRKTRSIIECKRYKATKYRFFLLYSGPIVLKKVLSSKIYNNFITLSLASSIMISQCYSRNKDYVIYAHSLMKHFVCQSIKIYGPDFVSHNIHNFLHLSDCVKLYGSLDNFSAFPFKNYMQQLKKKVRKSAQPLQQVIHRVLEESNIAQHNFNNIKNDSFTELSIEHFNGPLTKNCTSPQYRRLQTNNYYLNISNNADKFVELKNNVIVKIKNFAFCENAICLLGYTYNKHDNFYSKPCSSSLFNVQYIKKENNSLEVWNIDFIKRKLVVLPYKNKLVSFPLLHM